LLWFRFLQPTSAGACAKCFQPFRD
jgi:hypothetical protein